MARASETFRSLHDFDRNVCEGSMTETVSMALLTSLLIKIKVLLHLKLRA